MTWPTLSQPFITPISTSVQPTRNFYDGTTDWATWASRKIQFLMRTGVLANTEAPKSLHTSACKPTTYPLCAACQFGKQRQRASPGKRSSVVKDVQGNLKKDKLFPGQCVAVDHYILLHQGKTFHFKQQNEGHWHVYWRSTLCGHELQMSGKCVSTNLNTHQTLKANQDFELKCKDAGVIPLKYISDNGTAFTSKSYTLPISPISPKFNDLLELVHMKLQRRPFKPSYLLQEHGCSTQRYIGQKSLTPPFGQWQSCMLPISTTRLLIHPQASAQMISSPRQDGRKGSAMIFVFGDVHSMFWTRQILMARNFHVGNQELFEES